MSAVIPTLDDHNALVTQVNRLTAMVESLALVVRAVAHPPIMMSRLQAAKYAGVPVATIDELRRQGELVWHQVEDSKRFSRDDVDAAIRRRVPGLRLVSDEPLPDTG